MAPGNSASASKTRGSPSRRRPGGKRYIAGALLIVIGLAFAGIWLWTGWWRCELANVPGFTDWRLTLENGRAVLKKWSFGDADALDASKPTPPFAFNKGQIATPGWSMTGWRVETPGTTRHIFTMWTYDFPFWPLPATAMLAGSLLFWSAWLRRRRLKRGGCARCGYTRLGLHEEAPCPECGAARDALR